MHNSQSLVPSNLPPALQRQHTIDRPQVSPLRAITCPVCQEVLLPHQLSDHPHNTTRTVARWHRASDPNNLPELNRYHVYIPSTNEVVATIQRDPSSDMWRTHYFNNQYTHMTATINQAIAAIEKDSLETGQNLVINNWI